LLDLEKKAGRDKFSTDMYRAVQREEKKENCIVRAAERGSQPSVKAFAGEKKV